MCFLRFHDFHNHSLDLLSLFCSLAGWFQSLLSLLALVQYDLGWRLLYWRVLLFTEFFIIVEFHPHQTFCLLTNICGLIFSVWGVDKNFAQLEERDKLLKCWRRLQYPAQREQWTPNILQNFSLDDSIKQKSTKPWNPIIFFLFDTVQWMSCILSILIQDIWNCSPMTVP